MIEECVRCGHTIPDCAKCGKSNKVLGGYISGLGRLCHTLSEKPTCYEQATLEMFGCAVDSTWKSKR